MSRRRVGMVFGLLLLAAKPVHAQNDTSRDALTRLEETLAQRIEREGMSPANLLPAIVVSVAPAYENTRTWYPTAALASLVAVFGSAGLRFCEACMAPRTFIEQGHVEQSTAGLDAGEIRRLDERYRGTASAARTAIWLDESETGVSLRIVDLANTRIVAAENFDPSQREAGRTRRSYSMTEELDRRSRGDSINHAFLDFAAYPNIHLSFDWVEQWGATNTNLTGLSVSVLDPLLGIGASYFRIVPSARNITVGGKLLISTPTAIARGVADSDVEIADPLLSAVGMVRVPIASSNFALILSASTNGRVGVGFSLMNVTFMPFLP